MDNLTLIFWLTFFKNQAFAEVSAFFEALQQIDAQGSYAQNFRQYDKSIRESAYIIQFDDPLIAEILSSCDKKRDFQPLTTQIKTKGIINHGELFLENSNFSDESAFEKLDGLVSSIEIPVFLKKNFDQIPFMIPDQTS